MNQQAIKTVDIENFWGKYQFHWELNLDVNILIGINGSGKSTVLNMIDKYLGGKYRPDKVPIKVKFVLEGYKRNIKIVETEDKIYTYYEDFSKISTFDVPVTDKDDLKKEDTFLDLELERIIYQRKGEINNFTNYRLKLTDPNLSENEILRVNRRIKEFFGLINHFFEKTEKIIQIDSTTNQLVFKTKDEKLIHLNQLSSGEKQLLIILFRVFLQDEKPHILLMDEPELSLHVYWQEKLIDTLRKLNPNGQLIIATHSGSIFSQGYEDKIFWMEDLMKAK
jgi:predicted ATP-dependent endonuclease of OLD family